MLLSNYQRRRYQSAPSDYRGAQSPLNAAPTVDLKNSTPPNKTTIVDLPTEFDEYGTELHRDARVWKVYVKEADTYDAELVKGWNESTDVILIFAALFSAISTAFLIESSKLLQEDPAEVSTKTLLVISQTLLTIANGTQLSEPMAPLAGNSSDDFTPSRTTVCVNTLWYLSLSLSLATSFIAILSKDWCHSFMTGRTGHPYDQTCRRQQKWDMVEQWKMSELLAVLPSMIHLALLLFSIGLCIQLWDTHAVVAVPVVCVAGVAVGFYIYCSLAAIAVDFFPYPTIVSRFLRYPLVWTIRYVVEGMAILFDYLTDVPMFYNSRAYEVWQWLKQRSAQLEEAVTHMKLSSSRQAWGFGPTKQKLNDVESLALSWLIKNCEVPQSVDIALQSIAGANNDFLRGPLEECNAAKEISKRLASSNPYKDGNDSEAILSLYSRALSFLGATTNQKPNATQIDAGVDLEVKIWDRQAQLENDVAELITDGKFQPNPQNLAALRIGNTAASRSLQFLRDGTEGADKLFGSIIKLLEEHLNNTARLHPSALFSLVNGLALLSLFADHPTATSSLPTLCLKINENWEYSDMPKLRMVLIACALIQNKHSKRARLAQPGASIYVAGVIRTLVEFQSHEQNLWAMIHIGRRELQISWEDHNLATEPNLFDPHGLWALEYILEDLSSNGDTVVQYLQAHHSLSHLTHIRRPYPRIYVFVLKNICDRPFSSLPGWQLLSRFCFPEITLDLKNLLQRHSIGDRLTQAAKTSDEAMQFFAHGQLWLFFTLCLTLPPGDRRTDALESCVGNYNPDGITGDEARYEHLGDQMEQSWRNSRQTIVDDLGVYAYRLMECLLQSRNLLVPQAILDGLRDTPQELRGLSSFTDWQPQSTGEHETTAPVNKPQTDEPQMEEGAVHSAADPQAGAVGTEGQAMSDAAFIEPNSEPNNDRTNATENEVVGDRSDSSCGKPDTRESEAQPVARRLGEGAEEVHNGEAPQMKADASEGSRGLDGGRKVEDDKPCSANEPSGVPNQVSMLAIRWQGADSDKSETKDEVRGTGDADRSALGKGDVIIDMGK